MTRSNKQMEETCSRTRVIQQGQIHYATDCGHHSFQQPIAPEGLESPAVQVCEFCDKQIHLISVAWLTDYAMPDQKDVDHRQHP